MKKNNSNKEKTINKKTLSIILTCVFIIFLTCTGIYHYNKYHFYGTITNKYVDSFPLHGVTFKSNFIFVDSWRGNQRFTISSNEIYESLEVGKKYFFDIDWLTYYARIRNH